jgi:hypothetical protein
MTLKKILGKDYIKIKLSFLWIFVMLNYAYADIITLMDPIMLNKLLTGSIGSGIQITQEFLLAGSILMEIPIAMIILSIFLKQKWNRIANIFAGTIKTIAVGASMFVGTPAMYYMFFGTIEMITTIAIIIIAWKWKK